MANVTFDEERCKGCELCTTACNKGLVVMADYINVLGFHPATIKEPEKCVGCALCARMCPDVVIKVEKEVKKGVA